jgi:hypothetical protein
MAQAQNIGAHPTSLEYHLSANQNETQVIYLSNTSPRKIQFRLYLNDWIRDTLGRHEYYEPGNFAQSCVSWLTLSTNFVELEPGQSTQLSVKMQAPADAQSLSSMRWAMLFIETVEELDANRSRNTQAAVRNLMRIGVHIYQTPPALTHKEVNVTDFQQLAWAAKPTYRLSCRNNGQVMTECRSYLELANLATGKRSRVEATEFPMFPGQTRYVDFELPAGLPKGRYSALAVVDAGEELSPEAAEQIIEIP